jgi:predicted ATPase
MYALLHAVHVHELRREVQAVQEHAEAMIAVCEAQGFTHWLDIGTFYRGWVLTAQGGKAEGMAQMHQSLAQLSYEKLMRPYLSALLAEAYAISGQTEEGLTILEAALDEVEQGEGRFYTAELHRLKGELLLRQAITKAPQAEACFQQALDLARRSQAKWWDLRTATRLARLWQSQDKHQDAYDLLAPVYGWFTEGFDTPDLQDARTLLRQLSSTP